MILWTFRCAHEIVKAVYILKCSSKFTLSEHSFASVPASLYNISKSIQDPCTWINGQFATHHNTSFRLALSIDPRSYEVRTDQNLLLGDGAFDLHVRPTKMKLITPSPCDRL